MNLTRRSLLGLIKYPSLISQMSSLTPNLRHLKQDKVLLKASDWLPLKGIYDIDKSCFDWVLAPFDEHDKALFISVNPETQKTRFKSLDCSIMELADDIAYAVHDLEDAIVMGLINEKKWFTQALPNLAKCGDKWFEENAKLLSEMLFSEEHYQRKDAIGGIVNAFLTSIHIAPTDLAQPQHSFHHPLLAFNAYLSPAMEKVLSVFKDFVFEHVIKRHDVQLHEHQGQQMIIRLFEAFQSDPLRLLPPQIKAKWQAAEANPGLQMRIIADYSSAMTDADAKRLYHQMYP